MTSLPSFCAVCGGALDQKSPRCDHQAMRRGEVSWQPDDEGEAHRHQQRRKDLLQRLFFPALLLFFVLRLVDPRAQMLPLWLKVLLALLGGVAASWLRLSRQEPEPVRFKVKDDTGSTEGRLHLWPGGQAQGHGRGEGKVSVAGGFRSPSSRQMLEAHRRASAFVLLRAALLRLIGTGSIRAEVRQRLSWSRYRVHHTVRAESEALLLLSTTGGAEESLPWLERRLLSTLEAIGGGTPGGGTGGAGPYRGADQEPGEAARWVSVGELLRAFHRQERAQAFHRRWFHERVGADGLAGEELPWEEEPAELKALLTGRGLRRAFDRTRG
jgi:hypothetical protein